MRTILIILLSMENSMKQKYRKKTSWVVRVYESTTSLEQQKFSRGKNKKEREQELIIDDHHNESIKQNNNELIKSNDGIEFYNRSPPNDGQDLSQEDQDPYGVKPIKKITKKQLKVKQNLKHKANQEYLEQLKVMSTLSQKQEQHPEDEVQDDYTKEYLRQQKAKKSSRFFGTTQNEIQPDHYGLQEVKVTEVLESTRKTQRTNRTHRKEHDSVSYREDVSERDLGKSLTNYNVENKFSMGEVEYQDPLEKSQRGNKQSKQQPTNLKEMGGVKHQTREISYEEKMRRMREQEEQQNQEEAEYQVNHSYVSNENQRILESQEDERFAKMLQQQNKKGNNNEDFEDVQLDQNIDKRNNNKNRINSSVSESVDLEASNQLDKLHYNLSKEIKEAKQPTVKPKRPIQVVPFTKEQFKTLILNTYTDWYNDTTINWDIIDYLEVIEKSSLLDKFSEFLEENERNTLNINNMPFLDMGDKPQTFNGQKNEAEQIFVVPTNQFPDKIVVRYSDCKPLYNIKSLQGKYDNSSLPGKNIDFNDLQLSIMKASHYLQPYRGQVTRLDRINLINILVGLVITIALSMSIGITMHWSFSLIFIVVYFIFAAISIRITKKRSNKYLRQAHFILAVYCRAENNRFYLHNKVEMRPGFLAKWIEIIIHHPPPIDQVKRDQDEENHIASEQQNDEDVLGQTEILLDLMRERWERQKEMKKINLFEKKLTIDGSTKQGPIPIKDIEQYRQDQQLAKLLQMEEQNQIDASSKMESDQLYYGHNQDYEEEKDDDYKMKQNKLHENYQQPFESLDSIKRPKNLPVVNQDQIYSGLYDHGQNDEQQQQRKKSSKNKQNLKVPYSVASPQIKKNKYQNNREDSDQNSSMKKLHKNYYNDKPSFQQVNVKKKASHHNRQGGKHRNDESYEDPNDISHDKEDDDDDEYSEDDIEEQKQPGRYNQKKQNGRLSHQSNHKLRSSNANQVEQKRQPQRQQPQQQQQYFYEDNDDEYDDENDEEQ